MVSEYNRQIKILEAVLSDDLALRKSLQYAQESTKDKARQAELDLVNTEKARVLAQKVAAQIQTQVEDYISNLVTMALAAVFDDPYEFKVSFEPRRNQLECDMVFVKNGNECDPEDSSGGGAMDVASMALRIAIWSIRKTRAVQILDEPTRFVSRDLQENVSDMIKSLSDELGIQILMVSHSPEIIKSADRVFQVENDKGVAKIQTVR